jgi:hypothetical protein
MDKEKNIFKKIQNDIIQSNPKIINSSDNLSNIKKNLDSKYTEDLSDSDDDLSSYKLRNRDVINQMKTKTKQNVKSKTLKLPITEEINQIEKEINQMTEEQFGSNASSMDPKDKKIKNNSNSELNSDNSDDSELEYEYTEELALKVKSYVKNDDRIRELQTELKKLNSEKKIAEIDILKHLERLGESNINITGGKLRINQYESKGSLAEDVVREAIQDKIKDPKIIEKIFEKINEKRAANGKIQISLKRTFERGKK